MFLQGDKSATNTPTLDRENATRVLFGDSVNFAYDHNTAEFNQLVKTKYSDTFEATAPTTYNKYFNGQAPYEAPTGGELQRYYNETNPIPYQSFKPQIFNEYYVEQKSDLDEALLQKIGEVQIHEPKEETYEKGSIETEAEAATESYLKLNARGLIATITFLAVTLLIITLIIINSIAIGGGRTQIRRLREDNNDLQQQYNAAMDTRDTAYRDGVRDANLLPDVAPLSPNQRITIPPLSSYQLAPANSDASNNWFNKVSGFFSSLFG